MDWGGNFGYSVRILYVLELENMVLCQEKGQPKPRE